MVQFGVSLGEPGVIWADDVQVELGEKATPYKTSALDEVTHCIFFAVSLAAFNAGRSIAASIAIIAITIRSSIIVKYGMNPLPERIIPYGYLE